MMMMMSIGIMMRIYIIEGDDDGDDGKRGPAVF